MRVAILGAGNVATHLSKALINAGHPVVQVWSRNHKNAIDLALHIGANSIVNIVDIAEDIDLVVIAVNDDAISIVNAQIPSKNGRIVIHTAGSTGLEILNNHPKYGVLYPLQTFSKTIDLDFSKIPLCIEGSDLHTQNTLLNLASLLSNSTQIVNSASRIKLHISAVFACNFTNHFYAIAQELMANSALDFELMKPLIAESAKKINNYSPKGIQTGPAKRHDTLTMERHLKILETKPELYDLYRLISQSIVKMYSVSESPAK